MIRLDMHLYCICIYTHTLSIQGVKFGKCMRGNERQISGREKREVEKTATVACNGSFLSGVVQVGAGRRGVRSVGFLFTLQRLDIHRYREDLLYEYCGSPRVSLKSGCSFVRSSSLIPFFRIVSFMPRHLPLLTISSKISRTIDTYFSQTSEAKTNVET